MSGGRVSGMAGARLLALSMSALGGALALLHVADPAVAQGRRGSSGGSSGGGVFVSEMNDVQRVKVILHKSRTFKVDAAFSTIVAGSPLLVYASPSTPRLNGSMPLLYEAPLNSIAPVAIRLRSAACITGRWHAPHASRTMR